MMSSSSSSSADKKIDLAEVFDWEGSQPPIRRLNRSNKDCFAPK